MARASRATDCSVRLPETANLLNRGRLRKLVNQVSDRCFGNLEPGCSGALTLHLGALTRVPDHSVHTPLRVPRFLAVSEIVLGPSCRFVPNFPAQRPLQPIAEPTEREAYPQHDRAH